MHVKHVTREELKTWLQANGLYSPSEDVTVTASRAVAEFNAHQKAGVDKLQGLTDEERANSRLVLGTFAEAFDSNPFKSVPHASGNRRPVLLVAHLVPWPRCYVVPRWSSSTGTTS